MKSRGRAGHRRPIDASADEMACDDASPPSPVAGEMPCYDSDDSSLLHDRELFDVEPEDAGYETDMTDEDDVDVADQAQLWAGNAHSLEYYLTGLQAFNESEFDDQDYSPSSTLLLDRTEEQWRE